jgi:hypothetical protein
MWEKDHPFRWRTWIRTHLPWFPIDLGVAGKGRDCEAVGGWHHWYNIDNESSGCYHREVARPGQLWNGRANERDQVDSDAAEILTLQSPVEKVDGGLVLLIPLSEGGDKFVECARGISEVQGDTLRVSVPEWLVGVLRIETGDLVTIDNANGKLNIRAVNARPIH